ncbi:MAG: tetratricopeptide repeat protein [Nitrospirae bacterium]|nr:tetratricopeptide repeat protein [Nitrospirota bacterium]
MSYLNKIISLSVLLIVSACAAGKTPHPGIPDALSSRFTLTADDAEQGFKEGRDACKAGNAENALIIAHRISELYPDTPWYKRSLFLTEQALIQLDRPSEANASMLRVQAEYPELADYAVFLLADYHFAKARYSEAAALYEQVSERYPGSSLIARAAFKRGQALLESYAYPEAAVVFEEFLQNNPRSEFAPAAGLGLGRALTAEADLARAVRAYQDVWVRYPGDPNDQQVEKALSILKAGGVEIPELASAELYERGRNLFRISLHDKAVETFTKFLDKEPDSPDRPDALYRTGVSLYYLGKRGEASVILEKMIREYPSDERVSEALYWLGRSYSKLGDWDRGVQTFQKLLDDFPGSEWCDDALFLTGNIYREAGDMEKALQYYTRLVKEYSDSKFADSAIWWKAWWHYTSGDYVNAENTFQDLINRYPRSFLVNQARYWQGRTAEKREETAQAVGYYRQVLKKGPYTYYGHRAAERMAALGSEAGVQTNDAADTATAFVEAPFIDDEPDDFGRENEPALWTEEIMQMLSSEQPFRKIFELVHLDMKAEAAAELWSLKDKVPRRRIALMELSKVFFELGDYYRSLIIVLRGYERFLERPTPGMTDNLWLLAYPQGYWDSIVTYAGKFKQDPYFIAAIIREESQFRPDALSSAGARGLMQVMPATGKWAAQLNGLPEFDREKLFDSDTAINIGTWYVSHLMKQFRNNPLLVAAAYNAGPEAVQGWIAKNGSHGEWDLFVEMIPYAETRRYVKKVLRNYAEYKRIYAKTTGVAD